MIFGVFLKTFHQQLDFSFMVERQVRYIEQIVTKFMNFVV